MEKFYFLQSVLEDGRERCKVLSGQTYPSGEVISSTINVSADKGIRSAYPIGTTFVTDSLTPASKYISAGEIRPIGLRDGDYKDSSHIPSEEAKRAYERFLGISGGEKTPSSFEEEDHESRSSSLLGKMKGNEKFNVPTISKDKFYVDPDIWYLLMRNISNQINTMIIGDTGGGKTELVLLACKKLGISCSVYDMGSMYDPVAGLLGVHRLQEGGVSTFDYAKFTQDISKPGVVLLDELSRAPVTTNNILFPCLDNRRELPVEIAGFDSARKINVHPDCCFIATANIGAEYTGTMSMDRALVGRFFPIEMAYLPEEHEINVLTKKCHIPKTTASLIVKLASNIRDIYMKQEISSPVSTRETIMVGDLISDGWSTTRAMELVFLPLFEGSRSDGERGIITRLISSL